MERKRFTVGTIVCVLLDFACPGCNSTKQRRLLPMTTGSLSTALSDCLCVSDEEIRTHKEHEYNYMTYRRVSDCVCGTRG